MAGTNGKAKTADPIQNQQSQEAYQNMLGMMQRAMMLSSTISRGMFSSRLGIQFGGDRDLYSTFGYLLAPQYQDYKNLYDRQGLANRAVEKFAIDTWNEPAVLIDGEARSDNLDESATEFLKEWSKLEDRLKVWQTFRQADIMCGFSRYSIIFLGTAGKFSDPAGKNNLFYINAFDENQAQISTWVTDTTKPNFGLPETYTVQFTADGGEVLDIQGGNTVHFSRILHIAENKLGSRVYGRPRLQTVINRLFDLEKVTGGAAEATWLTVFMGFLLTAKDGAELPAKGSPEAEYMDEQINNLMHRIQRYATLADVDVHNLGVGNVDVRNTFDVLTDDLAGSLGIPKRILFGSERGELASSQDKTEWNSLITSRRTNFAEPDILRPFIDWCISHKILPAPASGKYDVEWKPVYPMTQTERAEYGLKLAQGAKEITGGAPEMAMDINDWRSAVGFPPMTQQQIDQAQAQGGQGGNNQPNNPLDVNNTNGGNSSNPFDLNNPNGNNQIPSDTSQAPAVTNESFFDRLIGRWFRNTFEGHKGRKGEIGGSLPRSAGETTTITTNVKFVDGNAKDLINGINGLDPSLKGFIAVYSEKEYASMGAKIYMAEDGKSGFAIKPNGELISVFSTARGRGRLIMQSAVDLGAKKLDCYEDPASHHLTDLYGAFGFRETERLKWNDQYAPTGWDYNKFDNPDVVFMEKK